MDNAALRPDRRFIAVAALVLGAGIAVAEAATYCVQDPARRVRKRRVPAGALVRRAAAGTSAPRFLRFTVL